MFGAAARLFDLPRNAEDNGAPTDYDPGLAFVHTCHD
jgi:hypothetical protein